MLLFNRRIGESVIVGNNVICTVLGLKGNQIRLGFSAPDGMKIYNEEVFLQIQEDALLKYDEQAELFNDLVAECKNVFFQIIWQQQVNHYSI